jgi:isopenicillin-N epimerase
MSTSLPPFPMPLSGVRSRFVLDPTIRFLNHGSFGACPRDVLAKQTEWRERLEREPVLFLGRQLEGLLDEVRDVLGAFVGADPGDLALVPNATTGVNTVLRSIPFAAGDEIVVTDHEYNACRNAAVAVAERTGARVVVVPVPFPLASANVVADAVLAAVGPRTRLVLVDHVTSQTGLVFPVKAIVDGCASRGVDVLVDGAHAPGMLPLDLRALGAAWYTGNCHKWLCTPKGAAFLHARRDRQDVLLPLAVSHGFNADRADRTRFRRNFDWAGTTDPTPWLCIPDAIRWLGALFPGGFAELQRHNHEKVVAARARLCAALRIPPPAPDSMLGSLAAVPLPAGGVHPHPLQARLFDEHRIEVPVMPWPAVPRFSLRVSAQVYNEAAEYEALAAVLAAVLAKVLGSATA